MNTIDERPTNKAIGSAAAGAGTADAGISRVSMVLRTVIAAVAMMICATAAATPYLIPAYARWLASHEAAGNYTPVLVAETLRFPLAALLALVLLLAAARIEKVRLRDYFGHVRAPRAWAVLGLSTLAAVVVTALAAGVAHLTGFDTGRAVMEESAGLPVALVVLYGLSRAFLLQGIQEEWWLRGFAFRGYRARPWFVLILTTLVFTALHLFSSGGQQSVTELFLYLAVPLGMGLWAGVERWCTGIVWGAVGVHGGIHTGLIVPSVLGWDIGPATWVVVGVALCAAAVVRLLVSRPWQRTG